MIGKKHDAANAPDDAAMNASDAESKGKRKKGKKLVGRLPWILLCVFVVGTFAVVGAANWHDQPSFCSAFCHDTMGKYVDGYEDGNGLARIHKEANVTCLDCHEATLGQQAAETVAQVTGDYRVPLRQRSFGDEMCLKCHISIEHLQAKTDMLEKDPHGGNITGHQSFTCNNCHKSHAAQVNQCSRCHDPGDQRMITYPLQRHPKEAK